MRDGSGDRLIGELGQPRDTAKKPLVVLIHGLSGCADSLYIQATAAVFLAQGYPVLRLNMSGVGPTPDTPRRHHYHAGRTEDLRDALAGLPARYASAGVFAIGFSMGGNVLIEYLAESGENGPVRAAAAISTPIDLRAASLRLAALRNRFYQHYLMPRMREEGLALAELSAREREIVMTARSVYEFDDRFVAPRLGLASADEFYARHSAQRFIDAVRTPTLVIHALDDPWIPGASYGAVGWSRNSRLTPLLPPGGGHVGFHDRGGRTSWHDRCALKFFGMLGGAR
ncbi:MAG: alpha/beta fold hydrolase [Rhodospirillales bacterium]|nr:alpha/beta fold hydrolase [Rhodospirillales bacterium]